MKENRKGSHTKTRLTAHIVWVTKYQNRRFARRHQTQMPRIARANLRCGRCANLKRRGFKRPRSYAHRISAEDCALGFTETTQRAFFKTDSAGVSTSAKAILGATLLGDGLRRVVKWQYHRRSCPRILGASSAAIEQG